MIVVDASIFVKLFKQEEGSEQARALMDHLLEGGTPFLAPTIVLYETLSAALHVGYPFAKIHELFDRLDALGLSIEQPAGNELVLAEKIATSAAPGGGYPTLFDSIYHAMAISRGGTFVTADTRHLGKAGHLGAVALLADWQAALAATPPPS